MPGQRARSTVFLPKEHGSWSLALEPLAFGLLVAPSWAGGALATAALAGFFARRPLKAALDPIPSPRRRLARRALVLLAALGAIGLAETLALGSWKSLWPLLPAACGGGAFLWFDAQGESRAAASEVAGSAAFALMPAALALLAGLSLHVALAVAVLAMARSVPTVLVVRAFLRVAKGAARSWLPLQAAGLALVAVSALSWSGLVPMSAALGALILFARAAWLLGPSRPDWPAKRVGMMEAMLGVLYVLFASAGHLMV